MCPVASTHGQKHGAWPAADRQTEWQFNMARLRDVRLQKAVNQEELESGAGDVDKSSKESIFCAPGGVPSKHSTLCHILFPHNHS